MSKHFLSFTESEEVLWVWVTVSREQTKAAEVCTFQGWSYRMRVNFQSRTKAVCSFTSVVPPGAQVLGRGGPGGPWQAAPPLSVPLGANPPFPLLCPLCRVDRCSLQVHRARVGRVAVGRHQPAVAARQW